MVEEDLKHNRLKLRIESIEDLWHLQHIISAGDIVGGVTFRRQQTKSSQEGRGEKRRVYLRIEAEKVEFSDFRNSLRITGKIISGPDDISLGSYHTLTVEPDSVITVEKEWRDFHLKRIEEASQLRKKIVIVVVEPGYAHISLVHGYGVKTLASITENLPSKRIDPESYGEAEMKFYQTVISHLENVVDDDVYGIVVAGPGWAKDKLGKLVSDRFSDKNVVVEGISGVGPTGVSEVLKRGIASRIYRESKIARESEIINKFLEELGRDTGKAVYGIDAVEMAAGSGMIDTLLITDRFFVKTHSDKDDARRIDAIMEMVKNTRGDVLIVSTEHEEGEKIESLGGICAILRYPLSI